MIVNMIMMAILLLSGRRVILMVLMITIMMVTLPLPGGALAMFRNPFDDYFDGYRDGDYKNDDIFALTWQRRTAGGQGALWPTSQSSSWVRTLTSSPGDHFSSF